MHVPTISIAKPASLSGKDGTIKQAKVNSIPMTPNPIKMKSVTSKYHLCGNRKTALVIVAYNRPDYLRRTMKSLINTLASPRNDVMVDIFLSQDGYLTVLDPVVADMKREIKLRLPSFTFTHLHHDQINEGSGYHKLSRHFGWFFGQMFDVYGYEQVIVLEVRSSLFHFSQTVICGRLLIHRMTLKWLQTFSPTLITPLPFSGRTVLFTASVHGMTMDKKAMYPNLVFFIIHHSYLITFRPSLSQ